MRVCWKAELVPGNLADSALKEELDSWVDLQLVELVGLVCWDPVGLHSLPGVGLGGLHSLLEPGLAVELHSLIELAGELHNLLGVVESLMVGPLLVAAGLDSWVDSLLVGLEVQQQLEREAGNWAPPRLEEL